MKQENVISILEALANGIDPVTGEVLPAASPYNQPDVIHALFHAIALLPKAKASKKTTEDKKHENLEKGLPENHGLPWAESDIQKAVSDYQKEEKIDDIAHKLSRKPSAIIGLLKKHGVITEEVAIVLGAAYR